MAPTGLTPGQIQGISAPGVTINPPLFYAATRRMRFNQVTTQAFAGLGSTDPVTLRQTGIVSSLEVRVSGTLTTTVADVTAMSARWPYGLAKRFKLSANGQSNLIDARGLTVKCHELATNPECSDRGITKFAGAVAQTQGTLAMASENWGTSPGGNQLGPRHTPGAVGVFTFDLTYVIPVAADPVSLVGAVFAQTTGTNLTLEIEWETEVNLLTIGGATTAWAVNYEVSSIAYSIPQVNGQFVVPDVTTFHQLSEFRRAGLTAGDNEILLPGVGVGRKLLRIYGQVTDTIGGVLSVPIPLTAATYGGFAWRYGGNDTPEQWANGQTMRYTQERLTGSDIGSPVWAMWLYDFASENALRDVVDEGQTSDLRLVVNLVAAPAAGAVQVAQETLFLAPAGA